MQSVLKKDIITVTVEARHQSAYHAEVHTSLSAGAVECSTPTAMNKTFQGLQLNVRTQDMVQQSLMNDEQIRDSGVLTT